MRIEAYTQVQQVYKTASAKSTTTKKTESFSDKVQISGIGKDINIAKQAVAQSPDIREDRVAELKAQIADGSYAVNADDFADKLVEKYNAYNALLG